VTSKTPVLRLLTRREGHDCDTGCAGRSRDSDRLSAAVRSGRGRFPFGLGSQITRNHATLHEPENRGVAGSIPTLATSTRGSSSKASDVESSRWASTCASRSLAFCSTVSTASAPATNRSGGGSSSAMATRALASLHPVPALLATHRLPGGASLGRALGVDLDRQVGPDC